MTDIIKDGGELVGGVFSGMPDPSKVKALEDLILTLPQVDFETSHKINKGVCSRTIFIKAGTVITGAKTNLPNICIVSGDITVTTDDGPVRLTGYHVISAEPGFKRAGIAHADTYWTTVWKSDLTDIEELEDEMTGEAEMLQTRRPGIEFERQGAIRGN